MRRFWIPPVLLLSILGFFLSVAVNIAGWCQVVLFNGAMALHVGSIAAGFLMLFAHGKSRVSFEEICGGFSPWVQKTLTGLFLFVVGNFLAFMIQGQSYPRHGVPEWLELRGFSGHWMVFFATATVGLWSALRDDLDRIQSSRAPPTPSREFR